jgi:hypothetical protein
MHRCQHSFKNPSNLCVVWVGNICFQEIFYAGKPQVVTRYILSNLWGIHTVANSYNISNEQYLKIQRASQLHKLATKLFSL